jgi:hypothetical protein
MSPLQVSVTIYLHEEGIHQPVEQPVEAVVGHLLAAAGLRIVLRDEPVIGS